MNSTPREEFFDLFFDMIFFVKKLLLLSLGISTLLATPLNANLRQGPHGGEVKRATGLPSEKYIELVIKGDTQKQEIHVYGLSEDYKDMNLSQSGYGGLVLRWSGFELPLDFHKIDESGVITNSSERVEHYVTRGKFPRDASVELDVTLAFPGKLGTSRVTFQPFRKRPD